MKPTAPDGPFWEVVAKAESLIAEGATLFQKFTCSGCGNRLTMAVPNKFYMEGECDNCPTITNIAEQGCGYLLVMAFVPKGEGIGNSD